MNKRRVTLNLDDDVIEALRRAGGRSLSDTANQVLREATAAMAHRQALLEWLDDLDATYGAPEPHHVRAADELLDETFGHDDASSAA